MTRGKRKTTEEKIAILKQKGSMTMKELAAKTGVGLSTLTSWKAQLDSKAQGKPKRKVAKTVEAPPLKTEEDAWEAAFNKYIHLRDEAAKAKKELIDLVNQLR